jgi:hypothetical protein
MTGPYGLEGLLPPVPTTIELQVARVHAQLAGLDNDLQKYLLVSELQADEKRFDEIVNPENMVGHGVAGS